MTQHTDTYKACESQGTEVKLDRCPVLEAILSGSLTSVGPRLTARWSSDNDFRVLISNADTDRKEPRRNLLQLSCLILAQERKACVWYLVSKVPEHCSRRPGERQVREGYVDSTTTLPVIRDALDRLWEASFHPNVALPRPLLQRSSISFPPCKNAAVPPTGRTFHRGGTTGRCSRLTEDTCSCSQHGSTTQPGLRRMTSPINGMKVYYIRIKKGTTLGPIRRNGNQRPGP